jgi:hypothetical protein
MKIVPTAQAAMSLTPINTQELNAFRDRATLVALKVMIRTLCAVMAAQSPEQAKALRSAFVGLRKTHASLVLKELGAVGSDMVTSEYQSLMEELLNFVEKGITGNP